jgi:hypothetical protein
LKLASQEGITYERFNELLLLLEQDRVSEPFYRFFFSETKPLKLEQLASSIVKFRGYAMLCYGDFRFAYKCLSAKNEAELRSCLYPFYGQPSVVAARYRSRPSGALRIDRIPHDKTWCLGYIAGIKRDKESTLVAEMLQASPNDIEIRKVAEIYQALGDEISEMRLRGLRNTDVYLTWDFMDVYVATSMRKRWEFEDVAQFVVDLFADQRLRALNLRYFDPTQSDCTSRIDKGLVEALMLKRASCTLYLVQESDTLGKDSELASTLAQGKPVIAFVPDLDAENYAKKIRSLPLEFFKIRFRVLEAEGVFDETDLKTKLSGADPDFVDTVNSFLNEIKTFAETNPLTLWEARQLEFKKAALSFHRVCKILAIAEKYNFDKRATILKNVHPLSLQVHLESGVANGVLVVRTLEQCAEVLHNLLTNSLSFTIEADDRSKCTVLRERISQSPFRAVTKHEKLANSFWNFYLVKEHRNKEKEPDGDGQDQSIGNNQDKHKLEG